MFSRSRSPLLLLLAVFAVGLALGPTGCASTKPRERWFQFWRPKQLASTSVYHPDRVILPPPPEAVTMRAEGARSIGLAAGDLLPEPPNPLDTPRTDFPIVEPIRGEDPEVISGLQTVYFTFDSADLDGEGIRILDSNLAWISTHSGVEIQIEGHCDERGTLEYNLLLGERRAQRVKAFLVQRGVPESILHTTSYGEERPIEQGRSELVFSKNRRAQFLVY